MAKTPAKPKSTKAAKPKAATEKKTTSAKSDPAKKEATAKKKPAAKKATAAKAADPVEKKTTAKKAAPKKATSSRTADPGAELAKQCQQVAAKFENMDGSQYAEIKEKLEWCLGSYNYDKNPAGLVDYGKQAVTKLKEARSEKPRQVPQKLIGDLEKALAKF